MSASTDPTSSPQELEPDPAPSKLLAIVGGRCPRCRKGGLFEPGGWIFRFAQSNKNCPVCGVTFEREPGFWQGAMYVGYALSVATILACFLVVNMFAADAPFFAIVAATTVTVLLLAPANFRLSRSLYIHLFGTIDYEPDAAANPRP